MSQETKMIQCFIPPMVAGLYSVTVHQVITKNNKPAPNKDVITVSENISKSLLLAVDAARFTLNAADVYSVYPPANQFGNYTGTLPHIVFTRRTLPWERTIDGAPPLFNTTHPQGDPKSLQPVPWMALILFNEDEMKDLKIVKNTLANIISSTNEPGVTRPEIFPSGASSGQLALMEWDTLEDGCFTIDITSDQFNKHIPSLESLPYLAHAKEVTLDNKDKEGIVDLNPEGTGVFSVIVGNNLPAPGKQHTAMLVSLEGFANYLNLSPANGTSLAKTIPDGNKVRLVVLANWNFNNSGDATFLQLADGLEVKALKIKKGMEDPAFASALTDYYDAGYVALEHLTRNGATTLSWYHGPFIPRLSPKMSRNISFSSSDAALRYDRSTGFFDISFAAAWQLGRMLALQNQGFSKAILNWRLQQKQDEIGAARINSVAAILNDSGSGSLKDKVIKYLGGSATTAVTTTAAPIDGDLDVPKEVRNFLGELYRLNGVPFSYLVPHEFFLEKEHISNDQTNCSGTLAFFYVDPNWIEAMLDGALSIGRVSNTDIILDTAMSGGFIPDYTNSLAKNDKKLVVGDSEEIASNQLNVTGFLLRSDLISGWRGIEIEGLNSKGQHLEVFRLERVDKDIFLGLFNGNVAKVVITQPYEGLHFGLKINDEGAYEKNIKNKDGSADDSTNVNDALAGLITDGIINIGGLAKVMKEKLGAKGWMTSAFFTSAEFAYQMVDSPVKRTITVELTVQ